MVNRHPDAQLLTEYVAGATALAPSIAVTTHLHFCDTCSAHVRKLNAVGGEWLEAIEPVAVSDGLLDQVFAHLDDLQVVDTGAVDQHPVASPADQLPPCVQRLMPAGELHWSLLSPSLRHATIPVGEQQFELALHRIKAGGSAPEHDHGGLELTVVLTGSFSDEDGLYQPGDFLVRRPGDVHRPLAAQNEECICLSVLEAPIRFTGFKRVFNAFLKFSPA